MDNADTDAYTVSTARTVGHRLCKCLQKCVKGKDISADFFPAINVNPALPVIKDQIDDRLCIESTWIATDQ